MTRADAIAMFLTVMVIPFIDVLPPLGLGAIGVAAATFIAVRRLS